MRRIGWILSCLLILFLPGCNDPSGNIAKGDEDWSFVVVSDVRQGFGIYSRLAMHMGNVEPAPLAAYCLGDIMLRPGNELEWINFRFCSEPVTSRMPLFLARGNHEGNSPEDETMLRKYGCFPGEDFYYDLRIRDALFIILDTEIRGQERSIIGEQLIWLTGRLMEADADTTLDHVFIMMHHPLFPQGYFAGSNLHNAMELHLLFLSIKKLKAVFAGHDHLFNCYIRDGLTYITSAGGGEPLHHGCGGDFYHFLKVSIYDKQQKINLKAIDVFNEIMEDFDLLQPSPAHTVPRQGFPAGLFVQDGNV